MVFRRCGLIRRTAFDEVGGFDAELFFMYCEDIDLSWRLWLKNWKCIYVPAAVVRHFTQDLAPGKRRTRENYYNFRNSLFLYYRFGGRKTARCFPASFGSGWFPELIPFAARLYSRLLWWTTSDIFRKYFKIDQARGPVILGFV